MKIGDAQFLEDGTVILDHKNELEQINELYVFISKDDTSEGIVGANIGPGGSMMPLTTSNARIMEKMKPIAKSISKSTGKKIKLVRFSVREDLEES